jgi:uncharacterized protein YjbI with pentapeptide repeats
VDDRLDLRGFSLEWTPEPPHVRGATFTGIDFSHAQMQHLRLLGCRLDNCLFEARPVVLYGCVIDV